MKQFFLHGEKEKPGLTCHVVGDGCLSYKDWRKDKYVAPLPGVGSVITLTLDFTVQRKPVIMAVTTYT